VNWGCVSCFSEGLGWESVSVAGYVVSGEGLEFYGDTWVRVISGRA
jgi:hypothetical protein